MSHTVREKTKLLNRVRRVRGQIEAVERALDPARKLKSEQAHATEELIDVVRSYLK